MEDAIRESTASRADDSPVKTKALSTEMVQTPDAVRALPSALMLLDTTFASLKAAPGNSDAQSAVSRNSAHCFSLAEECAGHYFPGSTLESRLTQLVTSFKAEILAEVRGLRGDVEGLRGDVEGLRGDVEGLRGDVPAQVSRLERSKAANVENARAARANQASLLRDGLLLPMVKTKEGRGQPLPGLEGRDVSHLPELAVGDLALNFCPTSHDELAQMAAEEISDLAVVLNETFTVTEPLPVEELRQRLRNFLL
ncbi:hypothetical protein Poli38472_004543 [Pythium oligandrum]|uniref:Uncharacterized protein n=1 Tax=Pythium oligandrum TaxID=41045 RepID=A0A8K1FFZ8_PYTOL|nr:hypothetical protein Poli38472_004543 [Pythium oligandrum]|eukprot:TMW59474.1 hypothetical protein Poli38472_004543 [Pythium oligandrum]